MRTGILSPRRLLAGLVLLACTTLGSAADKEEGFQPLFDGKDLSSGFETVLPKNVDASKVWTVEEGVIKCTGKPNGYFYTKKPYGNYVLRLEFKYPKNAGNSGYLIHIQEPHKVWPKCVEVQGQYGGVCSIFPIGGAKGPRPPLDNEARTKVRKPHTEWNAVEIICQDGKITSSLNGTKLSEGGPYDVKEGPIGFQSEGAEIHFRNLRIKEMK